MKKRTRVTLGAQPSRVKTTRRRRVFQTCGGGGGRNRRRDGGESGDFRGRGVPEVAPPVACIPCVGWMN